MNDICVGDGMNRLWREIRWEEGIRPKPPHNTVQGTGQEYITGWLKMKCKWQERMFETKLIFPRSDVPVSDPRPPIIQYWEQRTGQEYNTGWLKVQERMLETKHIFPSIRPKPPIIQYREQGGNTGWLQMLFTWWTETQNNKVDMNTEYKVDNGHQFKTLVGTNKTCGHKCKIQCCHRYKMV